MEKIVAIFAVVFIMVFISTPSFATFQNEGFDALALMQQKFAYDVDGNLVYQGFSEPGTAETDSGWMIKKFVYDVDGNLTDIQFAGNDGPVFGYTWSGRTGHTYE